MRTRLAQLDQSGATDGQAAVWDDAAGMWVPGAGSGGSGPGTSGSEQVTEWWSTVGSGATSRLLAYDPVGVPVVSLNGLVQRQYQEWTISGRVLSLLSGASALAGDVLEVTYHPDGTTPEAEATTSPVTVVNDSAHNAFPGLAVADDGALVASYRAGSGHATGVGVAKVKISSDGGATWGSAITVYSGADDFRDCVVAATPYGLLLTGFDYTGAVFPGLRVHRSTDNGATWSQIANPVPFTNVNNNASSAPIFPLPDGTLLWPVYGTDTGDTVGRTKVLASTDGGVTWTVRASLYSGSIEYVEPNLCRLADGTLLMMIRSDTSATGLLACTSTDNGVTWTTPAVKFAGQSGKPAVLELFGRVHLMYRVGSGGALAYAYSDDDGATWTAGTSFAVSANMYVYGAWADTGGLVPSAVFAEEASLSNADLYFERVPV